MTTKSLPAVEFDNVSIVFGETPATALPLMDQGQHRAEIQASTGQILGVHNCSLTVAQGEILVLMGLSGSGKSTLLRAVNGLNPVVRGEVRVRSFTADPLALSDYGHLHAMDGRVFEILGVDRFTGEGEFGSDQARKVLEYLTSSDDQVSMIYPNNLSLVLTNSRTPKQINKLNGLPVNSTLPS